MRSFTLSGIASFTLQNGKFFVVPSFALHANESRASQVLWRRRRMKRVLRCESENVGNILVKEKERKKMKM